MTTNQSGEFVSPNLLAGDYLIRVSSAGFKNVERCNILLEVAKHVRIDFVLQPGDTQPTIRITTEVPLVDSTSADLGGTLSNESINELLLNGRNFLSVLQLRSGVAAYPGAGRWSQSSNGLRPEYNVYVLDGIDAIEGLLVRRLAPCCGKYHKTARGTMYF